MTQELEPLGAGGVRDAMISIKGLMGTDEDGEDIELVTGGKYTFGGRRAAFEYMETELTGMSGTKTHVSVDPEGVLITRSGTFNMHMAFEEGRKNYVNYETPYGFFTMGLATQSIKNELTPAGGRLEVRYLLDLDNAMTTRNKVEININAREETI